MTTKQRSKAIYCDLVRVATGEVFPRMTVFPSPYGANIYTHPNKDGTEPGNRSSGYFVSRSISFPIPMHAFGFFIAEREEQASAIRARLRVLREQVKAAERELQELYRGDTVKEEA